jgi:excisionase family DNA binding protein
MCPEMATTRKRLPTREPSVEMDLGEVSSERLTAFLDALAALVARHVVAELEAERRPHALLGDARVSATPAATITIKEAAAVLGIKPSHAYELARRGEIPVLRLGRRVVVPRVALDELLARAQEPKE